MQKYVISLPYAQDRRKHIKQEFAKHQIDFVFFDAITPNQIDCIAQKYTIHFNSDCTLSEGEKACFLSHVLLWHKVIDEQLPQLVIFEDDICFGNNIQFFLQFDVFIQHIYQKGLEFDVIKLETFLEKVHLGKKHIIQERAVQKLHSPHMGAGAYIISYQGAQKLLHYIKNNQSTILAIDHMIFEMYIKNLYIYQINPAVCIQQRFLDNILPSQLEKERNNKSITTHKTTKKKILRLIQRIKRSIGKRTFYQIVPFQ